MKVHAWNGLLFTLLLWLVVSPQRVLAQAESGRMASMETRIANLEHNANSYASEALVLFLFSAFCALWAQNTGRRAWAWFFLGLLLGPVAVLILLDKNWRDRKQQGLVK